jgi:hypothetical protein
MGIIPFGHEREVSEKRLCNGTVSYLYGPLRVTTFDFTVSNAEKIKNWKMTKDGPKFKEVYKVKVEQTFLSKFGTFTIQQDVYVMKEKDQWKIAWEFGSS